MDGVELLRGQLKSAHQFLDMTIGDVSEDAAKRVDDGWNIKPIGAIYAHIAASEDVILNGMIRGGAPLLARDGWGEKLGITDPMPSLDKLYNFSAPMATVREYAAAVFKETDEYLGTVKSDDLLDEVDTPAGKMTKLAFMANIMATHCPGHWGEIAALKGVQGLKGLPF